MMATFLRLRAAAIVAFLPVVACDCDGGEPLSNVGAVLTVDPQSVDFGEVVVQEFRVRRLQIGNRGQIALTIKRFEIVGAAEFTVNSDVPDALGPEQTIDLTLTYSPTDVGEDKATVEIVAGDDGATVSVPLTGVGIAGDLAVTHDGGACDGVDGSMAFGSASPGDTLTRKITIQASGTAAVRVLSAGLEPGRSTEFTVAPIAGAPVSLAPGSSLEITATYTPVDGGPDEGAIVITTDAVDRPSIRIPVCGEGAAAALCADPVPLDLGAVAVGQQASATLTLSSCGSESLDLTGVRLSADMAHPTAAGFTLAAQPSLPQALAPGDSVTVDVEYTAATIGTANGWVEVVSTALGHETMYFPVQARAAQPCSISVAPQTISFNNVAAGSTDVATVLVANDGASGCTITDLRINGDATFAVGTAPTRPFTVAAGGSELVGVTYTPGAAAGPHMATLEVDEGGVLHNVALVGNPPVDQGCQVELTPPFLNFGVVPPGTVRTEGIEIVNISDDPCILRGVDLDPGSDSRFTESAPNFGLILPNRTKTIAITYRASAGGPARGVVTIETSDEDTPMMQVPLFATTGESGICVSPLHLPFGPTPGSADLQLTIYACGGVDVTVTDLDWSAPDPEFALFMPPSLPLMLTAGAMQTVTVRYTPTDQVGDQATLTVRSNDAARPAIDVLATGGPEIVPSEAGRYLYYWQIPTPIGGDVVRLPLQGATVIEPYWGPRTQKQCTGCHEVSPDGRYVALIELPNFKVIDTTNDVALSLPMNLLAAEYISWNPDVRTNPPYQFVYAAAGKIHKASLFDGYIGELTGANDPSYVQTMPTWGSGGQIAFVRGSMAVGGGGQGASGLSGASDVMLVDENGGTPAPLVGASGNNIANYYPRFSPNGQWVVITVSQGASTTISAQDARLRLVKADQSGTVSMLPNANGPMGDGASSYPTWSVDGRFVSFSSNRSGGRGDWDIYIAPVDPTTGADGPATNVTAANTPQFEHSAQWSP